MEEEPLFGDPVLIEFLNACERTAGYWDKDSNEALLDVHGKLEQERPTLKNVRSSALSLFAFVCAETAFALNQAGFYVERDALRAAPTPVLEAAVLDAYVPILKEAVETALATRIEKKFDEHRGAGQKLDHFVDVAYDCAQYALEATQHFKEFWDEPLKLGRVGTILGEICKRRTTGTKDCLKYIDIIMENRHGK